MESFLLDDVPGHRDPLLNVDGTYKTILKNYNPGNKAKSVLYFDMEICQSLSAFFYFVSKNVLKKKFNYFGLNKNAHISLSCC